MIPTARRSSSSAPTTIPLLRLPYLLSPAPPFLLFFLLISLTSSSFLAAASDHEYSSTATTSSIWSPLLQPPRVLLSLSLSVFGEMKTNPFGFVIKLPLGQPEAEQPLDDQEHLLKKQGASQPQANAGSSSTRGWNKCSYTVTIKTSCSSPRVTRDGISLVFGDAYRNEVYAARLDDPASGTFERCSFDTFRIAGPCGDRTCYLYLRRAGRDGWTPEYVKVFYSPADSRAAVTFFYKVPLPDGVWYGYNLCHGGGAAAATPSTAFNLLEATVGTENDMPDDHRMTTTGMETGRPTLMIQ